MASILGWDLGTCGPDLDSTYNISVSESDDFSARRWNGFEKGFIGFCHFSSTKASGLLAFDSTSVHSPHTIDIRSRRALGGANNYTRNSDPYCIYHPLDLAQFQWPPMFGSPLEAYSLRRYWGRFWHRLVYRPYLSLARVVAGKLHCNAFGSKFEKCFLAFMIFLISGVAHAIVSLQEGNLAEAFDDIAFYSINFLIITIEGMVIGIASPLRRFLPHSCWRLIGFVWVFMFWFWAAPKWAYHEVHEELSKEAEKRNRAQGLQLLTGLLVCLHACQCLFSLGRRGTILTAKLPYTTLGSKLDFLSDITRHCLLNILSRGDALVVEVSRICLTAMMVIEIGKDLEFTRDDG
ncbi:hypothetical protein KCU93_g325, partial [Aureobasidium melanogenum]